MEKFKHEMPPGFRFHPTDEELITHYLSPKILDNKFSTVIISEIDLNKIEPWELPGKAKMGEKEWYFFCKKDRKYPTGLRTNRASGSGYWKATGRDKEIFRGKKTIIGKKKSLVFYQGRAPKGQKSNWIMHEYRFVGKFCPSNSSTPSSKVNKDDWVICRIYNKSCGVKKIDISEAIASNLPALMDFSSHNKIIPNIITSTNYLEEEHNMPGNDLIIPGVPVYSSSIITDFTQLPLHLPQNSLSPQELPFSSFMEDFQFPDLSLLRQQSIHGLSVQQSNRPGPLSKEYLNMGFSVDSDMYFPPLTNYGSDSWAYEYGDQGFPVMENGPMGLDCRLNNVRLRKQTNYLV